MRAILFERDVLYSTYNVVDPGCINVKILNPDNSKMPVIIEPKSKHSVVEHISAILEMLQKDVFDRVNIKLYENTSVYIIPNEIDRVNFGEAKYIKVVFKGVMDFSVEPSNDDI